MIIGCSILALICVIAGILIYRNNQEKIDSSVNAVSVDLIDVKKIVDEAKDKI